MKKIIKIVVSIAIDAQITGFFMGVFYSNRVCREGIMSFKEMINRDKNDKIALLSSLIVYHGFKLGAFVINHFKDCGKITVQQLDR